MDKSKIIATKENLDNVVAYLRGFDLLAIDTETTGLEPFKQDRLFSVSVSTMTEDYYFNFNWYQELGAAEFYLDEEDREKFKLLFYEARHWIFQNAKFDLHFLNKEGMLPRGVYFDTQVLGRLVDNIQESYSLDALAERELGEHKDDAVMAWLEKNKCFRQVPVPGRKRMDKRYHFEQVPFETISKYAMKDTRLTYDVFLSLMGKLHEASHEVWANEIRLVETLFDMEQVGVQADLVYTKQAAEIELVRINKALSEWEALAGSELTDSGEYLEPIFTGLGFHIGLTPKGEYAVDHLVIGGIDHPLARILEEYRDAEKRYTTLMNILYTADQDGVVHTNFKQAGTVTGRMSSFSPNLQNLAGDDSSAYPIRRCFVPRPGFFFVSIDYQQMEFRLLLEYAGEKDLIEKIKAGHDPHQATADSTGLSRKTAKMLNFGLIYGMGVGKLARSLGVSEREARAFKDQYFDALPGVRAFLYKAAENQKKRGFTWNWMGRFFKLRSRDVAYRAPNSIIQGGCADVCKLAMNALHAYLLDKASRMILQVHDEVLFEVSFDEIEIIGLLKDTMEKAYDYRHLPLTCSVSYSLKSFHDMIEVESVGDIERDIRASISSASKEAFKAASEHMVL